MKEFRSIQVDDGIYLWQNAVLPLLQKQFIKFYLKNKNEFYTPKLLSGASMNLEMLCLGKHWNIQDNKYHDSRIDYDNKSVIPIPQWMKNYFLDFEIDVCVVNHYNSLSKLGIHQDKSESKKTIESGYPVISLSFGSDAIFVYGDTRKTATKKLILSNGDILFFGGKNRLCYHGITSINESQNYPFKKWINGRLNFTFRKY